MFDFLDKIGLKAVLEQIKAKFPSSLPANGGNADYATKAGNADTVNGRPAYRIPTLDANANLWDANAQNINDAYLQWDGATYFKLRTFGENLTAVDHATNADTVKNITVIGTAQSSTYNTILEWATSISGFGTACIIDAYGYPSDLPVQQEGLITVETCYQKSRRIVTFTSYADVGLVYQRSIWSNEWRYDWRQIKAGNADTLDGLHAEKFMRYEPDKNLLASINDMITPGTYGVYSDTPDLPTGYGGWGLLEVQAFGLIRYQMIRFDTGTIINRAKTVNQTEWTKWKRSCDGGNADTLDGLHADDFVNANDRDQTQIPSDVDVPVWIHTNGKRFHRYMTNSANIGLTNVPNNSSDYVWYWYDGLNILALEWAKGKYYICDMINGVFSGWKDVYTSGYKPYEIGQVTVTPRDQVQNFICLNFTPSAVICHHPLKYNTNGATEWAAPITNGFSLLINDLTATYVDFIAFK